MKTRDEIKKIVTDVLIDKLGVDPHEVEDESANLQNDIGMDSLDAVELIMEFEKEFNIGIPDDDAERAEDIRDIIDYLVNNQ